MYQDIVSTLLSQRVNVPGQFAFESGITVTHVSPGRAEGVLQVSERTNNPHFKVHGGALATLADTVAGCCACSQGESCVTSSQSMEFLRPAGGTTITCVATPKKLGRALSVVAVELYDDQRALVATGTFSFFMLPGTK